MRLLLISTLVSLLSFASCNSNKDKITIKDDKGNTATIDLGEAKDAVEKIAEKMENSQDRAAELRKLQPLTLEQLKALIPSEVMGMSRSSFNTSSAMGVSVGSGTYKGEGDKEIKLEIVDCAGEMGANWYTMRFFNLWNFEQEDDNGYQKTVDFNGNKAIEKYSKASDRYELTFVSGDRFLVNVEGEKVGLDAVKQVAGNLNLKAN